MSTDSTGSSFARFRDFARLLARSAAQEVMHGTLAAGSADAITGQTWAVTTCTST
jgi:hypothetical protein